MSPVPSADTKRLPYKVTPEMKRILKKRHQRVKGIVEQCDIETKKRHPNLKGTWTVFFHVNPKGKAQNLRSKSNEPQKSFAFDLCLKRRIEESTFQYIQLGNKHNTKHKLNQYMRDFEI